MKILKISYYVIMTMLFAWFVLSWREIAFNNMNPDFTYHSMNLINLLFRG